MAKKKSTSNPRHAARSRKMVRDRIATPTEMLQHTVRFISDGARMRPPSCLIGDTPAGTISTCRNIVHWLATSGDDLVAVVNPKVLRTVADALAHAEAETKSLWTAAQGIVKYKVVTHG